MADSGARCHDPIDTSTFSYKNEEPPFHFFASFLGGKTLVTLGTKTAEAERVVNSYMGWSAGAGLIPLPMVDLAAITAVELKMLDSLSKLYNIRFSRNAAKSIIGSLVGGTGTVLVAAPAASFVKFVPFVGTLVGVLTEPAIAAAATYALGRVFIQHFESGGTFLDFNPEQVREYFHREFENAKTSPTVVVAATAE